MSRIIDDLHHGAHVLLPDGRAAVITARQAGPLTLWKTTLDVQPCWRDDQLRLTNAPAPTGVSEACANKQHLQCGGGYMVNQVSHTCTCQCGHVDGPSRRLTRPPQERRWADHHQRGQCATCGAPTSKVKITRCRSCANHAYQATRKAMSH